MSLKDILGLGKSDLPPQGCRLVHVERAGTALTLQFMRADGLTYSIEVYASWAVDTDKLKQFAGLK